MAGRNRDVSDATILRQFALSPDPVLVASELADTLDMSRQGVFSRLEQLEEDGYLRSAKKASARVWWITEKGRRQASEELDNHQT